MSSLLPALALAVVAVVAAAMYLHRTRRFRQTDADRLAAWGRPKGQDRDLDLVSRYHVARVGTSAASEALDARTWADLDLDAVFAFLDRTESVPGRQVLYHRLRSTTHSPDSLPAFDGLAERFGSDVAFRLRTQRLLASLNANSVYWLWSLALEPVQQLPRWAVIYPVFAILMLVSIGLIPVLPKLIVVPVVGLIAGSALRAKLGVRLVPMADAFRDMVRLLTTADRLAASSELPDAWRHEMRTRLTALAPLRRWGGWLGRDASSADLVGLFIEYMNLLFCLDANAVMLGVRELRLRQHDLHAVFEAVGSLDAALAVASARASGRVWTRPVFASPGAPVVVDDLRHLLLEDAVPNSIVLGPPAGVLVTGANMTGKSTFLRTVGVNVVLAQTICTVFASNYEAPWLSVRSCITPSDDLKAGKSYYQAEVETLVAMLNSIDGNCDEAQRGVGAPRARGLAGCTGLRRAEKAGTRLFLFDELFRGTNTLDRIGAASAVLAWLVRGSTSAVAQGATQDSDVARGSSPVKSRHNLVIAATHDLELVSLLAPDYSVVHFADQLAGDGLQFDFRLRPGPTTTRNAIALLGVLGAPQDVVAEALERTERLRAMAPSLVGTRDRAPGTKDENLL